MKLPRTAEIVGPQDAPNIYADSVLAWCPSSLQGTTVGEQSGGDAFISYSFDTWSSYLSDGYTEFIEAEVETPVFVQSVEIGENRGMFSVVRIKAWDSRTSRWQSLYAGEADVDQWAHYSTTRQYHKFVPSICQTTFASSVIRLELDTFEIVDWNEIDYLKVVGATTPKAGVLDAATQTADVYWKPNPDFNGDDCFSFRVCDCAYDTTRSSEEMTVKVSVVAVNDVPVSRPISVTAECAQGLFDDIRLESFDVDVNASIVFTIVSLPSNAALYDGEALITSDLLPAPVSSTTVSLLADYDGLTEPPSGFGFTFAASDEEGAVSAAATVTVTCSATTCPPGRYYDMPSLKCEQCPAGTFAKQAGIRSRCELCPVGTFNSQGGSDSCVLCPNGQVTLERGSTECVNCPRGASCKNTSSVIVKESFWRPEGNPYAIFECRVQQACLGGSKFGDRLCAEGYIGPFCAVCDVSYFLAWTGMVNECKMCNENRNYIPTMIIGVVLVTCAALVAWLCIKTELNSKIESYYDIGNLKGFLLFHACQVKPMVVVFIIA